ncbi:ATP-dependent DNA helicase RecG [Agrococcus baldri]|uniref:Probable DNA 3'-5' helicase RecG n=1 Tax=Agrococcus baldri TaxID=153730 RepID=A0AA87RJ63_9MICO|nr:ATP-dependent DNA helicase RecG [Agrococcus baldri]GEK81191.1 ATP-dependent DNA helicase RecG [Agrococcus baldri]
MATKEASGAAVPGGFDRPVERVVGKAAAGKLERAFGIATLGDLVWHLPRRYAKRGELTELASLVPGEHVTVVAKVATVETRDLSRDARGRPRTLTSITITDGTSALELAFFNQAWRKDALHQGVTALFSGTVGVYKGTRQLAHPDVELFDEDEGIDAEEWANQPVPIYPATATLATTKIQALVAQGLDALGEVPDPVPTQVRAANALMPLAEALRMAHQPKIEQDAYRARHTLAWQEAFLLQTYLLATRDWFDTLPSQPRHPGALLERFDAGLPWRLTDDQAAAGEAIAADLASGTAMHRLVQGEVGSGKTVVATRAMLTVAESGGQAALLAPTEVLAVQHLRSITRSLGPDLAAELQPTLLTGQMPAAERKRAMLRIAAGQARIVVGTHALLSEKTSFAELALVVIDEQHRFGVAQREALRSKGLHPHTLVLTATPIPRTIAMTAFGDLDVSTIRSLPAGRSPIQSFVVDRAAHPGVFHRVWQRMHEEIEAGRQAFVVCPAISPGKLEGIDVHATGAAGDDAGADASADAVQAAPVDDVTTTLEQLRRSPVGAHRIAPLHGGMSTDDKDRTMRAFRDGEIDALVATTVIEVGVDVPNATMMVVLSADRFGVSQLHQLRGRVGRGEHAGLCMLVTSADELSDARERLDAVAGTLDGFALAEVDLEQRGEGDVLGHVQSGGRSGLRVLRVSRDGTIIEAARDAARAVLDGDPKLERHSALRHAIDGRLDPDARAALVTA